MSNPGVQNSSPNAKASFQLLTDAEKSALDILMKRKERYERQKVQMEESRRKKDRLAVGWMFLTMDPALAKEVIGCAHKKRDSEGQKKKGGVRLSGLKAKEFWGALAANMNQ
jgi:hypothetical protein